VEPGDEVEDVFVASAANGSKPAKPILHDGPGFRPHPRQVAARNLKSLSAQSSSPTNHSPIILRERTHALFSAGTGEGAGFSERNPGTLSRRERVRKEGGFVRDYYELALEDGGVYRVFRDLDSHRWFLDGAYD
jgi:hypothetical protein